MRPGFELIILVAAYTFAAAITDYKIHKIPNWLTVPTALLGLLYHAVFYSANSSPLGGLAFALTGFFVGFFLLMIPAVLGGGGMGDVKLLAALGAWLGWKFILITFGIGSIFAAVIAIAVITITAMTSGVYAAKKQYLGAGVTTTVDAKPRMRRAVSFAVPIALSSWLVLSVVVSKPHLISLLVP